MDGLVYVLALMGAWLLLSALWQWVFSFRYAPPPVGLLFLVRDNEDKVEGLIRQLALDCYSFGRCQGPGKVFMVDLGSTDQTPEILRRLARQYSFLHLRLNNPQGIADLTGAMLVLDMRELTVNEARMIISHTLTPGKKNNGESMRQRGLV